MAVQPVPMPEDTLWTVLIICIAVLQGFISISASLFLPD